MQTEEKILIVHFGELWLRGKNRNFYIRSLKRNITEHLRGEDFRLFDDYDRLIIKAGKRSSMDSIKSKISKVFGVSAYEVASTTKPTLKSIIDTAMAILKEKKVKIVKINSHRAYKGFKFNSIDIIKGIIKESEKVGITPSLSGYDREIFVSVKKDRAYIYLEKNRGSGGLPLGTSGKCVILISGGIDSPVAAWYAMKRGLFPVYVHVHGFSSNREAASSKIPKIIDLLSQYSPRSKSYYVPSHIFQLAAIKSRRYELILMKAFMLRLAEKIAKLEGATAIITGESLGQVASQTIPNITAEQDGIKMPILRPLIGFDKQEITKIANDIGTYSESIKPYKDVCSINAKSPVTNSNLSTFKSIAKEMGLNSIVSRSLKAAQIETKE